ncbi:MAG: hypothetical protein ACD_75C00903G0001, partial [uncultured bacterium]
MPVDERSHVVRLQQGIADLQAAIGAEQMFLHFVVTRLVDDQPSRGRTPLPGRAYRAEDH